MMPPVIAMATMEFSDMNPEHISPAVVQPNTDTPGNAFSIAEASSAGGKADEAKNRTALISIPEKSDFNAETAASVCFSVVYETLIFIVCPPPLKLEFYAHLCGNVPDLVDYSRIVIGLACEFVGIQAFQDQFGCRGSSQGGIASRFRGDDRVEHLLDLASHFIPPDILHLTNS
ncbi:MAG TPA: hypothetical protein PLO86_00385 [Syntrophales bacterium]|nr:hypothetical protein [Syntrophales bacterium]